MAALSGGGVSRRYLCCHWLGSSMICASPYRLVQQACIRTQVLRELQASARQQQSARLSAQRSLHGPWHRVIPSVDKRTPKTRPQSGSPGASGVLLPLRPPQFCGSLLAGVTANGAAHRESNGLAAWYADPCRRSSLITN